MSLFVDLTLDKRRRFKYGLLDLDNTCNYLNSLRTLKDEVDGIVKLMQLLSRMHPAALGSVLCEGLKHQDPKIKSPEQAKKILSKYLENGGSMEPVSDAIMDAMHLSGLISKEVYELVKSKQGRDGDGTADDETTDDPDADPIRRSEPSR